MSTSFITVLLLICTHVYDVSSDASTGGDTILQFYSSAQFADTIYKKQKAFFVQFYSSQDKNAVAFSPIWRNVAENIMGWNEVVQLASVDCELDDNAEICKEQNLKSYPTLKYFKYESVTVQDALVYEGKTNKVDQVITSITRFVLADFEKHKPASWPDFTLAHDSNPGENLWHHDTHYLALVFETYPSTDVKLDTTSLVGAQVILDFAGEPGVLVRRGTSRHQLARANDIKQFPGLLMFSRSHHGSPAFASGHDMTREEMTRRIRKYIDVESGEQGREKTAHRDDL